MSFMELIIPNRSLSCICKIAKALSLDGNTATNITCNGVPMELLRLQFLAEFASPME
jgi:hypothetical protein